MVWLPVSSDTVFVTSVDCSICCMGTCGEYCDHPLYTRTDSGAKETCIGEGVPGRENNKGVFGYPCGEEYPGRKSEVKDVSV